jgi:hypothetical protein
MPPFLQKQPILERPSFLWNGFRCVEPRRVRSRRGEALASTESVLICVDWQLFDGVESCCTQARSRRVSAIAAVQNRAPRLHCRLNGASAQTPTVWDSFHSAVTGRRDGCCARTRREQILSQAIDLAPGPTRAARRRHRALADVASWRSGTAPTRNGLGSSSYPRTTGHDGELDAVARPCPFIRENARFQGLTAAARSPCRR